MSQPFALSIRPLTPAEIPPEEEILSAANEILESTLSWKEGKSFHKHSIRTFSRPRLDDKEHSEAGWCCRVSQHTSDDATFDQFWSKLGENKAENEMQYIPEIKKVQLIKEISPTMSIWTLYYTFGPIISPRVFTVLQVKRVSESEEGLRKAIIISIPIDLSSSDDMDLAKLEEKGVRGRYTSVEQIEELPDGKVEWRMATSSTPGGSIPRVLADATIASKIAEDVPHFLKWFHSL